MTTVLHVITGLDTGGAEMMLYKLVARSDPARYRHVVVSLLAVGPVGHRIAALAVPVHSLDLGRALPDPRATPRLLAVLRRVRPDVIQTWLYHADLLGQLGGALVRTPVVWNIRSTYHRDLGLRLTLVARACARVSRFPAAVVTNSYAAKELHTRLGYRPKEWLVIPNGFDTERFAPDPAARQAVRRDLGLPADAPLIGLVARFDPMKDHRTFLRAAGVLAKARPEVHFVLAGRGVTGENKTLREAVAAEGLPDRVHLLGERDDIPSLTAALDVATCSSVYGESFPTAVGEAMSCAVPCVVTDVGDAARIVGDTGRVVPRQDAAALAAGWRAMLDLDPEGRRELGRRARVRVEALYSLDSVVRQYESLYERLAARSGDAAVLPS